MADYNIIQIDGQIYFYQFDDIKNEQLRDDLETLHDLVETIPALSSDYDIEFEDGSQLTGMELISLKSILGPIQARTNHLAISRIEGRRLSDVQEQATAYEFERYGGSTYGLSKDRFVAVDGEVRVSDFRFDSAKAYLGLSPSLSSASPASRYSFPVSCDAMMMSDLEPVRTHLWDAFGPAQNTQYCETNLDWPAKSSALAQGYVEKYKEEFEQALDVLAAHHPHIDRNNLAATLLALMELEIWLYDDSIDIAQDVLAAKHADSPELPNMLQAYEEAGRTRYQVFASDAAVDVWIRTSGAAADIGDQGFGPLQVKTNLLKAAYANKAVYEGYDEHLLDTDLHSEAALIRTALNPRKSIFAKAMVLDLQLRQFSDKPGYRLPADYGPYIVDDEEAHQITSLWGAYRLVQFPEDADDMVSALQSQDSFLFITLMYRAGSSFGYEPRFDHISVEEGLSCPAGKIPGNYFGQFTKVGSSEPQCLISSPLEPDFSTF